MEEDNIGETWFSCRSCEHRVSLDDATNYEIPTHCGEEMELEIDQSFDDEELLE